jgi:hypothetical protein
VLASARGAPRRAEMRLMAETLRAAAPSPLRSIDDVYG